MLSKLSKFHWRNIRGLITARDGISAVEFALIAPVMVMFYFGAIELSLMMQLDRKVTTSTATLGDLVAREDVITNAELDDIFQATRMIFQPEDITAARMRVSGLYDDAGTIKVSWSDACNMTAYAVDDIITVPADIVPPGGSVIYAQIEYDYTSTLGYFFSSAKTLDDEFYLRPRRVDFITRQSGEPAYTCAQFAP